MNFLLTGLNHKTASVDLRERLSISESAVPLVLAEIRSLPGVEEVMVLSTCNRVEILIAWRGRNTEPDIPGFLEARFELAGSDLRHHLYLHREAEAICHLFRVACSLDSLVLGEPQILGQVKAAYAMAREQGAIGSQLERLLQDTFALAKRVRTETQIGASPVNISTVAVDLARRIFGSLEGKRVLLLGAGKMSELAARHLVHHGASRIIVANRTLARAQTLAARFDGEAMAFDDVFAMADVPDILIASTGAERPVLTVEQVQQFLHRRRRRPMLLVDIAVPRDVEPEVNRLEGAFLYDIDDLQSVASANLTDRKRQAELAEELVLAEALRFEQRRRALDVGPLISEMHHTVEQLCQAEMKRIAPRLSSLSEEQQNLLRQFARGLTNKFLHLPMHALRSAAQAGDVEAVQAIQAAFDPSALRNFTAAREPSCPHTGLTIEDVQVDPAEATATSQQPAEDERVPLHHAAISVPVRRS